MANGKITWAAPPFRAVTLDEAHYLYVASAAFNPGTGDFGIDFLFYPDSTQGDTEGLLCGKGAADMANLAGWQVFVDKTNKRLVLKINDGAATVLTVNSNNDSFAANTFSWARLEIDRDGLASFWVNGSAAGSGSISSRAGSLNNSESFKIGGLDAGTNNFKGRLGLLRVDLGRLLPASWVAQEWDRLRYGLPRAPQDFTALWLFGESLADESGTYTLTYAPSATPAYAAGYPSGTISYTLEKNYRYGLPDAFVDGPSPIRVLNGSFRSHDPGWRKRRLLWEFANIRSGQVTALLAAAAALTPVTCYPDADLPPLAPGLFVRPPEFQQVRLGRFDGDIEVEEV
jgi:hypothetical protein